MSMNKNVKKRLSGDERKKQILKHTFNIVSDKGFKDASTREIAKAAGINEALIYKYYPTKNDLLKALLMNITDNGNIFDTLPEDIQGFKEQLLEFCHFFLNNNNGNAPIVKIILYGCLEGFPLPNEFNVKKEGTFLFWLHNCIEKGKREWNFNNEINSLVYVSSFMGSLIYFVLQSKITTIYNELINDEEYTNGLIDSFINSLIDCAN